MLSWAQGQKRLSGTIYRYFRESEKAGFYPDGAVDFWFDGDRFRIEFNDMWGDQATLISDGKTLLEDSGSDPVTLRNVVKPLVQASGQLEYRGLMASPLFYLLQGPALLGKETEKDTIKLEAPNLIVWDSATFGKLKIEFEERDKHVIPLSFAYNNMPLQKEMAAQFPDFDEPLDSGFRWSQRIVFLSSNWRRGLFDTRVPRGRTVSDLRVKPKKPKG